MNMPSSKKVTAIVSPVSRHLYVADVERSTAFYRDVLGFEIEPVRETYGEDATLEVVRGPARIQLGAAGRDSERLTPQGVFFAINDVSGMHGRIRARGGEYYCDVLGFSINYQQTDLGVMYRDSSTLLLIARTNEHAGIGSCSFYVRDADAVHDERTVKGANVLGTPVSYPWGLRHFHVLDLEGNRLSFSQTFE